MTLSSSDHDLLREQVELYVLGALTPAERTAFEAHLSMCDECRTRAASLSPVVEALSETVPQHEPSPSLRSRVLGIAATQPRSTGVRPRIGTRTLAPWLSAAALLAIAAAAAIYASALRSRIVVLERQLAQATERAQLSERQVAELRRTATAAQSQVAVLAAPDLRRIDLAGQTVAPQSTGRAFWSRSQGLMFTVSNLPPPPVGRTYQLWVLTREPAPISAGVFKPDAAGRAAEWFNTPADLPQPVGMAVTIEPEGGVAAPTGEKYLVGL